MSETPGDSSTSSLASIDSDVPTRPPQPPFTKEQKKFLTSFLPAFFALGGSKKGTKRDYVEGTPFVAFKNKYNSDRDDGPNLEDLLDVCYISLVPRYKAENIATENVPLVC
jgi:hypothetical protein